MVETSVFESDRQKETRENQTSHNILETLEQQTLQELRKFIENISKYKGSISISFIRHPQSTGQLYPQNQKVSGQTPELNVTTKGTIQTKALIERLSKQDKHGIIFHKIYASPANRTGYLADYLTREFNISPADVESDLAETDKRGRTGLDRKEIYENERVISLMKKLGSDFRHGKGESERDVILRILGFITETILAEVCFTPKLRKVIEDGGEVKVGAITHQGTIKALLVGLQKIGKDISKIDGQELTNTSIIYNGKNVRINELNIENTSITKIRFDGQKWEIELIGDASHLTDNSDLLVFENIHRNSKPLSQAAE